MSTEKKEKDPYAALRYKEFNIFYYFVCYFCLVDAIYCNRQVYSITKDPFH
jgi:hypothetical protein